MKLSEFLTESTNTVTYNTVTQEIYDAIRPTGLIAYYDRQSGVVFYSVDDKSSNLTYLKNTKAYMDHLFNNRSADNLVNIYSGKKVVATLDISELSREKDKVIDALKAGKSRLT